MKKKFLLLLSLFGLMLFSVSAQAVLKAVSNNPNVSNSSVSLFSATQYGSCTWDGASGHDVGPCINAAIAAAAAAGGGTVVIPANPVGGVYYFATVIANTNSGVHLQGAGTGQPRDSYSYQNALAATTLLWNGTYGAGPAVDIEPQYGTITASSSGTTLTVTAVSAGAPSLVYETALGGTGLSYPTYIVSQQSGTTGGVGVYTLNKSLSVSSETMTAFAQLSLQSADISGILFDCQSGIDTCVKIAQTGFSFFRFAAAEGRKRTVLFTTTPSIDAPGVQNNDVWLWTRCVNPSYSASCVTLDAGDDGLGSNWNTSYNRFHEIQLDYGAGDGLDMGGEDTNQMFHIIGYHYGTDTTGSPVVIANSAYVPPNGVALGQSTGVYGDDNQFVFSGFPLQFQGYQTASTWTANSGNTGTGALNITTLTTSASSAGGAATLNFAATSPVVAGESINCGGVNSGVYPGNIANSVTSTLVYMRWDAIISGGVSGVASGTSCSFSYGITQYAAPGTYTITAASSTTFNITAPSGGHSQSGIAISNGAISFEDVIIPFTGTPVANDSWTLTVPSPSIKNQVIFVDKANAISDAHFEIGATGTSPYGLNRNPVVYAPTGGYSVAVNPGGGSADSLTQASGVGSFIGGGFGDLINPATLYESIIGGLSNTITNGDYGFIAGWANTISNGIANIILGAQDSASGNYTLVTGNYATDRGRSGGQYFAAGEIAVTGDAQSTKNILHGTASTASTGIRLTSDGLTASSINCVNIPNNTAVALTVDVVAYDHTTIANNESWNNWTGLLTRGASASATTLTMNTTPTPITNGTVTGSSIAASADTTNGCLNITFTTASGSGSDKWNVMAHVRTEEVQ